MNLEKLVEKIEPANYDNIEAYCEAILRKFKKEMAQRKRKIDKPILELMIKELEELANEEWAEYWANLSDY